MIHCLATSVIGSAHVETGMPCQDTWLFQSDNDAMIEWCVMDSEVKSQVTLDLQQPVQPRWRLGKFGKIHLSEHLKISFDYWK